MQRLRYFTDAGAAEKVRGSIHVEIFQSGLEFWTNRPKDITDFYRTAFKNRTYKHTNI